MTKKERAQYASLCSHLQAEARKNGTQYTKPERPDAHTLDSVTAIVNHSKKDVKTLQIRMKLPKITRHCVNIKELQVISWVP